MYACTFVYVYSHLYACIQILRVHLRVVSLIWTSAAVLAAGGYHVYIYACIHMYTYVYTLTCAYIITLKCTFGDVCTRIDTYLHVYTHYTYVCKPIRTSGSRHFWKNEKTHSYDSYEWACFICGRFICIHSHILAYVHSYIRFKIFSSLKWMSVFYLRKAYLYELTYTYICTLIRITDSSYIHTFHRWVYTHIFTWTLMCMHLHSQTYLHSYIPRIHVIYF